MNQEMFDAIRPEQKNNWWFKARKNIVKNTLSKEIPKKKNKILEIGCGYGIMTELLQEYGQIDGIDSNKECYAYLHKNLNGHFINANFMTYRINQKYDIIALFDVLEHIENDKKAITKISNLLENRGKLILTVPAYMFLWSNHDLINDHYRRYTKTELKNLILKNKFKIKKISYFNTFLFPIAFLDKMTCKKKTKGLNPGEIINSVLYFIFDIESKILPHINFPFGVSILVIAEKDN